MVRSTVTTKLYATVTLAFAGCSIIASAQQYPPPEPPQQYPPQQQPYPPQQYPAQSYPGYNGPAPQFAPEQLDNIVGRIALYPDPLLAQVLTAATYPDQIPQAASWANAHRYLAGPDLTAAMQADQLYFEPNVMALIPFPDVLDMMARDPAWTQALGSAVLANRAAVMDAVQRMRQQAYNYGYLRSNAYDQVVVPSPGIIQVLPVQTGYYFVPHYNPAVVFVRPRPGFYVGGAITFGPRIFIGASFGTFGWMGPSMDWRARTVIVDGRPWQRTWVNRAQYVHPYAALPNYYRPGTRPGPRYERHEEHRDEHRDRR
jgi:hypothetical protein